MDQKGKDLLKLLFNEGETVCVSNSKFGYHSIPLENALEGKVTLVQPDPTQPVNYCDSSELLFASINPIKGWRRDENITAFRSYLIEIDTGTIQEQLAYLDKLQVPTSARVFSGGKSVHTALILDEDLMDQKTYRDIGSWILNVVSWADPACRNPSRSIRIPGAYREPGKKQRLISLNKRISSKELFDWLSKYEHLRPKAKEKKILTGDPDYGKLSPWAKYQLVNGIDFGRGRSNSWFALAVDFAKAGYNEDQAVEILEKHFLEEHDFREKEWRRVIQSGYEYTND